MIQPDAHLKMLQQLESFEIKKMPDESQSRIISDSFSLDVPNIKSKRLDIRSMQITPNIKLRQNANSVIQFDHKALESQKIYDSQRDSLYQSSVQKPPKINNHQITSENVKHESVKMYLSEHDSNEQSIIDTNPFKNQV